MNKFLRINPKTVGKKFKKPIYPQNDYWDIIYNVIGKRTAATKEDFISNQTLNAFIDGGDSSQRLGMYYTGIRLLEKNNYDVSNLKNYSRETQEDLTAKLYCNWTWGLYRRFPDPHMWYGDEDRFSRDQAKPVISMEAMSEDPSSFSRLVKYIIRHFVFRLGLFDAKTRQNGTSIACHGSTCDYGFKFPAGTFFTTWASYIRALYSKSFVFGLLYPLLLVFDLQILVNALIKQNLKVKYHSGEKKLDNDVSNHVIYSCWFAETLPTPIIWFMNKYVNSKSHFIEMLYDYHDDGRENYILPIMWEELISIYFRHE